MFKRKIYNELLDWKQNYADHYACLIEGARRVGKSTIAKEFAIKEYKTYIFIDFSIAPKKILSLFDEIYDLDKFFLKLQSYTHVDLYPGESLIIFDEIQFFPKARQAIKHLVSYGKYHYLETGSLISIKKNVQNILIPSEEHKIEMFPLDYEEFLWATNKSSEILRKISQDEKSVDNELNRSLMSDFRLYLAIGGMPQAIDAYIKYNNLSIVDSVKKEIIDLYYDDLKKIDPTGRISKLFQSIPSQLVNANKHFVVSKSKNIRRTSKTDELISDLIDSKIVLPCYNVLNPNIDLFGTQDFNNFKLYLLDTGLFVTLIFNAASNKDSEIYNKLLADKLAVNLGYVYENAVAQILVASHRELFYHTWQKENSTHNFEIDFLLTDKQKIIPIEVKSSNNTSHKSLDNFIVKYSKYVGRKLLISQKDFHKEKDIEFKPLYSLPFILEKID